MTAAEEIQSNRKNAPEKQKKDKDGEKDEEKREKRKYRKRDKEPLMMIKHGDFKAQKHGE